MIAGAAHGVIVTEHPITGTRLFESSIVSSGNDPEWDRIVALAAYNIEQNTPDSVPAEIVMLNGGDYGNGRFDQPLDRSHLSALKTALKKTKYQGV